MALQVIPFTSSWRDAKGFIGKMRMHIAVDDSMGTPEADVNTLAADLITAIGALTNCAYAGSSLRLASPPTLTFGTNAEYPAEFMKAVYTFTTDLATISRFKIPAPKLAQFTTDGVTVDNGGSNTPVVNFVNAVKNVVGQAYVSTNTGLAYTHFVGGIYRGGIQQKRFNQFIKSAHLEAGEGE